MRGDPRFLNLKPPKWLGLHFLLHYLIVYILDFNFSVVTQPFEDASDVLLHKVRTERFAVLTMTPPFS